MDSPKHLIGQSAAEHGVSANMAKRALYLEALGEGRSIKDAASAMGVQVATLQVVARKYMIDFVDYRPYAALEKKGLPRPQANCRDIHLPAGELPIFSA